MSAPTIFVISDNGELIELSDQPYDSEKLLQRLLAQHPSVLAGDQMGGGAPLKWLLVATENGIPDKEGGAERWSVDHVFIDQNAVPTLVEVKRSTDSRIRREVVGQMLDYAANAVLYWPVETIRERFVETCREREVDPDMVVADFLPPNAHTDTTVAIAQFWETVETNLRAGKLRLIFAADIIPPELRRIVEFLNEQMNPAEVVAVEIRQYVGTGLRTLVPTVIRSSKRIAMVDRSAVRWDRDAFLESVSQHRGVEIRDLAVTILEWARTRCPTQWWGRGRKLGSCYLGISHGGINYYAFSIWTSGRIEIPFQWLRSKSVPQPLAEAFAERLNAIPGIAISRDFLTRRPTFDMALLREPEGLFQFLSSIEWLAGEIRRISPRTD